MQLTGIHHLTAVSANAPGNRRFYHDVLGLRLVKKTVNQDDVGAYHLFYADYSGSPGTDITFFDWPAARERRGTHSISRTGLRVASPESLAWWKDYFLKAGVAHSDVVARDGRPTLDFEDPEGQRLALVVDDGAGRPDQRDHAPVPAEHQIHGLGPITMSVPDLGPTDIVLTKVMNMRRVRDYPSPERAGDVVQSMSMRWVRAARRPNYTSRCSPGCRRAAWRRRRASRCVPDAG